MSSSTRSRSSSSATRRSSRSSATTRRSRSSSLSKTRSSRSSKSSRADNTFYYETNGWNTIERIEMDWEEWLKLDTENIVFKVDNKYYLSNYNILTKDTDSCFLRCIDDEPVNEIYCKLAYSTGSIQYALKLNMKIMDKLFSSSDNPSFKKRCFVLKKKDDVYLCEDNIGYHPRLFSDYKPKNMRQIINYEYCKNNINL